MVDPLRAAVKFNRPSHSRLELRCRPASVADDGIKRQVSIVDGSVHLRGPGLPQTVDCHSFGPISRVDGANSYCQSGQLRMDAASRVMCAEKRSNPLAENAWTPGRAARRRASGTFFY
jgi:hypothetical protein